MLSDILYKIKLDDAAVASGIYSKNTTISDGILNRKSSECAKNGKRESGKQGNGETGKWGIQAFVKAP